jgi:hypothetical protein
VDLESHRLDRVSTGMTKEIRVGVVLAAVWVVGWLTKGVASGGPGRDFNEAVTFAIGGAVMIMVAAYGWRWVAKRD